VRGICGIRPGVEGLSENITVRSIIGRFLEHHRIFYYENDGDNELYVSSADWLDRNFFRRVETCVPIEDTELKLQVFQHGLEVYLKDNINAWQLNQDGSYTRIESPAGIEPFSSQQYLLETLAMKER
jgi:polyphosphate kinase